MLGMLGMPEGSALDPMRLREILVQVVGRCGCRDGSAQYRPANA